MPPAQRSELLMTINALTSHSVATMDADVRNLDKTRVSNRLIRNDDNDPFHVNRSGAADPYSRAPTTDQFARRLHINRRRSPINLDGPVHELNSWAARVIGFASPNSRQ